MSTFGAIRYGGTFNGGVLGATDVSALGPSKWRYRVPWFCTETGTNTISGNANTQPIVDQEIAAYRAGGIDYWAMLFYPDALGFQGLGNAPGAQYCNYDLERYQTSTRKSWINYCLMLAGDQPTWSYPPVPSEWPAVADLIVTYMAQPEYQKVLGSRPLLYLFGPDLWVTSFGGSAAAKTALDLLRSKCATAGVSNPYLVALGNYPSTAAAYVASLGAQAITTYSTYNGNVNGSSYPIHTDLVATYWNTMLATGAKIVPNSSGGWDPRPRAEDPTYPFGGTGGGWCTWATPGELAAHFQQTAAFIAANSSACEADTTLFYAGTEPSEGCILSPCPYAGGDNGMRLQTIAQSLGRQKDSRAALRARGIAITTR